MNEHMSGGCDLIFRIWNTELADFLRFPARVAEKAGETETAPLFPEEVAETLDFPLQSALSRSRSP